MLDELDAWTWRSIVWCLSSSSIAFFQPAFRFDYKRQFFIKYTKILLE